jgi:hypothetical protein
MNHRAADNSQLLTSIQNLHKQKFNTFPMHVPMFLVINFLQMYPNLFFFNK